MNYPSDFTEEMRSQGICGVLAIAIAANVTIAEAHAACKRNLVPGQKRHVRSTHEDQIEACLREFGIKVNVEPLTSRQTVRRWIEANDYPHTTYLIYTSGHVMVYRDGRILDQSGCSPVLNHRCKRCFVQRVVWIG